MDYLLDDLIDYTMEKVAAYDDDEYNEYEDIEKARKNRNIGRGVALASIPVGALGSAAHIAGKRGLGNVVNMTSNGMLIGGLVGSHKYNKQMKNLQMAQQYRIAREAREARRARENKEAEKTAMLNDLVDYTMEKVAAEELDGKERYEQEMGKARKRQIAGRVLTGAGLGVGVANIGMFGRDAMKIGKQYGTDPISQMNPEYQAAAMAAGKKFYKRGLAGQGVFAAGLGTGAYNKAKKRKAERQYMQYLENREGNED